MKRIVYVTAFGVNSGYAKAATDNLMALEKWLKDDDKLFIVPLPIPYDLDSLHSRYASLRQYVVEGLEPLEQLMELEPTHVMVHTIPTGLPYFAQQFDRASDPPWLTGYTTWETDRIGRETAYAIYERYDRLLVPCEQNKRVFTEAGYDSPIAVVPHAHDPGWWHRTDAIPRSQKFTFYWIGVWSERKNPMGLLKAYLTEFTAKDDVQLIMACNQFNKGDIERLIRCIGLYDLPSLSVKPGAKSDEDIRALHHRSHCYVTAARGEGFGLGAHEAALCGNSVIAPDWGGQAEALTVDEREGYLHWAPVGGHLTPAITQEEQTQHTIQVAGLTIRPGVQVQPIGIDGRQLWFEPDLAEMRDLMRSAYEEWKQGEVTHPDPDFAARFTYEAVGRQLYEAITRSE